MAEGWISIHRKIRDNHLFKEKRVFSKFEAWLDLLLEVNHQDNKFILGNELVEVKRGSTITSIRQLCDKWGWSNTKVKKFFELLELDEMITHKSDTKKTLVSIVNYGLYQPREKEKRHENDTETTRSNHENDTKTTRKHTNNNVNNDNNENNVNNDNKNTLICVDDKIPYTEIIDYLNIKTKSTYKHTTPKTRDMIKTRFKEGFNLNDFKKCIDNQTILWLKDPKMNKYLRPDTLFSNKFESYVNNKVGLSDMGLISQATEKNMTVLESWAKKKEREEQQNEK